MNMIADGQESSGCSTFVALTDLLRNGCLQKWSCVDQGPVMFILVDPLATGFRRHDTTHVATTSPAEGGACVHRDDFERCTHGKRRDPQIPNAR